jgi:glutathione S-transferase
VIRPKRLYDFLESGNGYRVRLALTELELAFEYVEVDILKGETQTPEFLKKNPAGEIPVLELEDGTLLRESAAILFHVTDGTHLLPAAPQSRTRVLEWMFGEQSNIDRGIGRARFRKRFPSVIATTPEESAGWHLHGYRALSVRERHLEDHDYFVDDRFTAADITLYAYTHCASEGGFVLERFPKVLAWFERVRARPRHIPIDRVP